VIMAGIRTAAVWVIGTATLSTPIGQTSLGNYIFAGLQTQNWVFVLFGCAAAAGLALAVDQLLALIESGLKNRKSLRTAFGGVGIAALVAATLVPQVTHSSASYVVGAKTFAEQYVLSSLIVQRLRTQGLSASRREGLGSNVVFDALAANDIDVYVDYSGTLWVNQFHRSDIKPREELLSDLKGILAQQNITLLGELGFENAYALVMPRKRAEALHIRSIADLAPHTPTLSIAGDYEFFSRPEWASLRKAYGLSFRMQRQMQPDFMYAAVASGDVDVIAGYTSDGLIAKYDLVALDDPRHAIPPYDAIMLLAPKRANDMTLQAALRPLLGRIAIADMREANLRASGNDADSSPDAVARWLWEKVGKR
jgi:osmoprotectant transport system permease protein